MKNTYKIHEDGYVIATTSAGKEFIFDVDDLEKVCIKTWTFRADNRIYGKVGDSVINVGRYILGDIPDGMCVDHINGNPLDNRKCNLRIATRRQNMMNRKKNKNSTSNYKGVYYNAQTAKWGCTITHKGKHIWLGGHDDEISAAQAYNSKATEIFGEFARLNII